MHRLYRVQKQLMMSGSLRRPPSELISCRRRQTRRGRQPRRALDLGLHLPADDYILAAGADNATATPPSPRQEDGLELTLAVGSGGACRRKRRDERAGTGTPLGSDCSGGSLTSTSTDTASGSPAYRRGMPAFRLQEGAAAAAMKQPQPRSPWLVQCLSLKMA